jgi:hypothetical protein
MGKICFKNNYLMVFLLGTKPLKMSKLNSGRLMPRNHHSVSANMLRLMLSSRGCVLEMCSQCCSALFFVQRLLRQYSVARRRCFLTMHMDYCGMLMVMFVDMRRCRRREHDDKPTN